MFICRFLGLFPLRLLVLLQTVALHGPLTGPAAWPAPPAPLLPPPLHVGAGADVDVGHLVRGVHRPGLPAHLPAQLGEEAGHHVAGVRPHVGRAGGAGGAGGNVLYSHERTPLQSHRAGEATKHK